MKIIILLIAITPFLYSCEKQVNKIDTKYFLCEGSTIRATNQKERTSNAKTSISITKGDFDRKNHYNPKLKVNVLGHINFDGNMKLEICSEDELNFYLFPTCDVSSYKEQRKNSLHKGRFEKVSGWFIYREEYNSDDTTKHIDEYYYKCSAVNPVIK